MHKREEGIKLSLQEILDENNSNTSLLLELQTRLQEIIAIPERIDQEGFR